MTSKYTKIKISGKYRLHFNATEDRATNSLAPTIASVKANEHIDLAAKADKLGTKAARKAIRQLLDFPNHLAEPQTGAKLLGLVMSAQAAPLYTAQDGTLLPSVQIVGMLRLPESVGDLLRALQGSEDWSGDGWHLSRPWVVQARFRIGAALPETAVYRYAGGKLTALMGEKKAVLGPVRWLCGGVFLQSASPGASGYFESFTIGYADFSFCCRPSVGGKAGRERAGLSVSGRCSGPSGRFAGCPAFCSLVGKGQACAAVGGRHPGQRRRV